MAAVRCPDGEIDFIGCKRTLVVFGFAPKEVPHELDQERVTAGGLGGVADEPGGDGHACLAEGGGEGVFDFPDGCSVKVDLVRPPEEGRNALIE